MKDFHLATIQQVTTSISHDCDSKPNVYLAHHSNLDLNSLYDQVHLYKAAVPPFARTLKDIALKRSPNTSQEQQINRHALRHAECVHSQMVGVEGTPAVGIPTAHLLAVVL